MLNKLIALAFILSLVGGFAIGHYWPRPFPRSPVVIDRVDPMPTPPTPTPTGYGWRIVSSTTHGTPIIDPAPRPNISAAVRQERELRDRTPLYGPPGVNSHREKPSHSFTTTLKVRQ